MAPQYEPLTRLSRGLRLLAAALACLLPAAKMAPARFMETCSRLLICRCTALNPGCFMPLLLP